MRRAVLAASQVKINYQRTEDVQGRWCDCGRGWCVGERVRGGRRCRGRCCKWGREGKVLCKGDDVTERDWCLGQRWGGRWGWKGGCWGLERERKLLCKWEEEEECVWVCTCVSSCIWVKDIPFVSRCEWLREGPVPVRITATHEVLGRWATGEGAWEARKDRQGAMIHAWEKSPTGRIKKYFCSWLFSSGF